jgi:hypothetical protein
VQNDLPVAFYRAPGKGIICRVPDPTAPGKEMHPANQPLPSAGHSAKSSLRQKSSFAECRALGKARPSAKVVDVTVSTCRHPLPSAAPLGTRQSIFYFF